MLKTEARSGLATGTSVSLCEIRLIEYLLSFTHHRDSTSCLLLTAWCPSRQQRFGRLLKTLKSADPTGNSDGATSKPKTTSKRAAPGKQNGDTVKKANVNTMHAKEEGDESENEDEPGEEETPSKKHKSGKQGGTLKWKSIFERDDNVVKVENREDGEYGASRIKVKDGVDGEVVN
jgi:hypothetical protein